MPKLLPIERRVKAYREIEHARDSAVIAGGKLELAHGSWPKPPDKAHNLVAEARRVSARLIEVCDELKIELLQEMAG